MTKAQVSYAASCSDKEDDDSDGFEQEPVRGLIFDPAEPDYLNYHDQEEGAQVILTMEEVRDIILEQEDMSGDDTIQVEQNAHQDPYVRWLTTKQMRFALEEEQNELVNLRDVQEGKTTARYLAPAISEFVRNGMNELGAASDEEMHTQREAYYLDQVWGKWDDNVGEDECHPQPGDNPSKTARWDI